MSALCMWFVSPRMGAYSSSPATPEVRAEAVSAAPPQGCPMHQDAQPAKGTAAGHIWPGRLYITQCRIIPFQTEDAEVVSTFCPVFVFLSLSSFRVSHASSCACKRYKFRDQCLLRYLTCLNHFSKCISPKHWQMPHFGALFFFPLQRLLHQGVRCIEQNQVRLTRTGRMNLWSVRWELQRPWIMTLTQPIWYKQLFSVGKGGVGCYCWNILLLFLSFPFQHPTFYRRKCLCCWYVLPPFVHTDASP